MSNAKPLIIILLIAIFLLAGGVFYSGYQIKTLQDGLDATTHQLELSQGEITHLHEAWDGLYLEYEVARDVADFWYGAYSQARQDHLDCLDNPVIKEVEVIKEVPVEVVKEVEVIRELDDWQSLNELTAFLEADDTDQRIVLVTNDDGVVYLTGYCEDAAFQLVERAELIGKQLDTEILTRHELFLYEDYLDFDPALSSTYEKHMIVKAIIGNEVWYIEPANDNIWLDAYLD